MLAVGFVALLFTYPFGTLTGACARLSRADPGELAALRPDAGDAPPVPAEEPRKRAAAGRRHWLGRYAAGLISGQ